MFAQLDCAPEVLALTGWYSEPSGLDRHDGFSISCLPGTATCVAGQEIDVLEAAHLVAHADDGTYDVSNGRLLCANHHRAYDADLYSYHPATDTFTWSRDAPEPYLGRH